MEDSGVGVWLALVLVEVLQEDLMMKATKTKAASEALPLFPDLLDANDPYKRQRDHLYRGHGVWSIGDATSRMRPNDVSDSRHLSVEYDDERFHKQKTGKPWTVQIKHYLWETVEVTTGWGKSHKKEMKPRQRYREVNKAFATREEACVFAEKLLAILERVEAKRVADLFGEPDCIEEEELDLE